MQPWHLRKNDGLHVTREFQGRELNSLFRVNGQWSLADSNLKDFYKFIKQFCNDRFVERKLSRDLSLF